MPNTNIRKRTKKVRFSKKQNDNLYSDFYKAYTLTAYQFHGNLTFVRTITSARHLSSVGVEQNTMPNTNIRKRTKKVRFLKEVNDNLYSDFHKAYTLTAYQFHGNLTFVKTITSARHLSSVGVEQNTI